jgi:uncharacterized protein YbaP (TraB family)
MNRLLPLADRLVEPSLRLLAAINVLFLASFCLVLLLATGKARAEDAASCGGKDLLSEITPAEAETIKAAADATLNGKGTLWKIEKAGLEPSWLFGTMHMTDPRVSTLSAKAQSAYESTRTIVIETTDVLDERKMMSELGKEPELMMFTDGSTLTSKLSAEDAKALEAGLQERGIPIAAVAKMKPWMLIAMVALPACEMARKASGAPVLDAKLALEAQADGKTVAGLETASEQLRAMASLPMEFHTRGLVDTLKLGDRMDDVLETMIVLYEREEIGMFWPLLEASLGEAAGPGGDYTEFEQTMIVQRNHVMADRSEPILSKGSAFIAVGALHLPGQEGFIELLRAKGFTLTRAQ